MAPRQLTVSFPHAPPACPNRPRPPAWQRSEPCAAALILFGLPRRWIALTVSFSAGLLLAMTLLRLLPDALEDGLAPYDAFAILLGGILGFSRWRKSRSGAARTTATARATRTRARWTAKIARTPTATPPPTKAARHPGGRRLPQLRRGLLIAAAFLANPALGWSATLAVIAREAPQEASDFAALLGAGWKRGRAFVWNLVSGLTTILGGLAGYFALDRAHDRIPVIVTPAASSFLYVAIADLTSRIECESDSIFCHAAPLAAGIAVVALNGPHVH
jgi:zinc and cadmium transporter